MDSTVEPGHKPAGVSQRGGLSGPLLAYMQQLDAHICTLAAEFAPESQQHSPLLPVAKLDAADHFTSFPHQAMFAAAAAPDTDNLKSFAAAPVDAAGHLNVPALDAVDCCLTPGACYPIYIDQEGAELEATQYITVRSTCFRQEERERVQPLIRQRAFTMRELVCMGTQGDVEAFLATLTKRVQEMCQALALPIEFIQATDPFFEPRRNKKYLMQKVAPVKMEMTYQKHLAIGSVNDHRNGFGNTFGISLHGEPIHSGCVAFGLERWLYCLLEQHGSETATWPAL